MVEVKLVPDNLIEFTDNLLSVSHLHWCRGSERVLYVVHDPTAPHSDTVWSLTLESGCQDVIAHASAFHLAADGETIALVAQEGGSTNVTVKRIDDANPKPFFGLSIKQKLVCLRWCPDSRHLLYIAERPHEDGRTVYHLQVHNLASATPMHNVELPGCFAGQAEWSHDGSKIALTLQQAQASASECDIQVFCPDGDVPLGHELWLYDLQGRNIKKLDTGHYAISSLLWNPCDTVVYIQSKRGFEYRTGDIRVNIHACDIEGMTIKPLFDEWSGTQFPMSMCFRTGRLAFLRNITGVYYPEFRNLVIFYPETGEVRQLTDDLNVGGGIQWSPCGDRLYFRHKKGRHFPTLTAVSDSGFIEEITHPNDNPGAFALSAGGRLAWLSRSTTDAWHLTVANADGSQPCAPVQWRQRVSNSSLGEVENIVWRSADGLEINGFLIRPVDYRLGKQYPLLVDIHGGPVGGLGLDGAILCGSPLEWHMWAMMGYAVLCPDYRTSIIDWNSFAQCRERQDYADQEFNDVMSGVDHVIAQGLVDSGRMAVVGHSWGSSVTNSILTRTDRFKAAVSYEGFSEDEIGWGGNPKRVGGNASLTWWYKGRPWEVPENYRRNAWIHHLHRIKTPTLLIEGGKSVGGNESRHFYSVLHSMGVPVELVIYQSEGHVVAKKENREDLLRRAVAWITRFVPYNLKQ